MHQQIDVDQVPFDRSTFWGRVKYFAWITDPRLSMLPTKQLCDARDLLEAHRQRKAPPEVTEKQLRRAQQIYLSAFHPDTGELQNVVGRMSFQVPGGMVLIGAMLTFYKSNMAVIFWQWANQSFNATVNFTNRNAKTDVSTSRLVTAYVSATSCALIVALSLKRALRSRTSPVLQRLVPFAAVIAANIVNTPLMRQGELIDGVLLYDENDEPVTTSRYAAVKAISQVVTSRISIAAPSMALLPFLMQRLEVMKAFQRYKFLSPVTQIFISAISLIIMVPVGCALFDQKCSIKTEKLKIMDKESWDAIHASGRRIPQMLHFNKGL